MPLGNSFPLIGHVYSNAGWQQGAVWTDGFNLNRAAFVKVVGPFTNTPAFKMTSNGTHQQITVQLPVQDQAPTMSRGQIMTVTELGGDGAIIYAGIINDIGEVLDAHVSFPVVLDPIGIEAPLYPFETNYTIATDAAQMVRDAVALTKHLTFSNASVPLGAPTGLFDFRVTGTVLKVLQEAAKIAGANYAWFIDEQGVVWFGNQSTAAATYTVRRGEDYTARKLSASIEKQYNYLGFIGGTPPTPAGAATASQPFGVVYDDGHIVPGYPLAAPNFSRTSALGVRARMPHFRIRKLLDQTTLNNIAQTIGTQLNRPQTKIELTLRNFQRITLSSAIGATMRYYDPNANMGLAEAEIGVGGYSPIYLIEDVERAGNVQKVILTDLVQDTSDLQYQIDKMIESAAAEDSTSVSISDIGVVTPGMVVGATGGGPLIPTTPSFYP